MVGGPYCYAYDGNGLRVAKSNGSSCGTVDVLYWRNVAGNTIAETDSTGSTTDANYHEYVFFAGRRVARSDPSSGYQYYYFADQIGSTRSVAEVTPSNSPADGTVCFNADYYPYGQEIDYTTTCPQSYKFTGYERDGETGLDYAVARYYNDRLGRFMSADPVAGDTSDPQSLNRYDYVRDNPVNLIDPSGASIWSWFTSEGSGGFGGPEPCWSGACDIHGFSGGPHSVVLDWAACAKGWKDNGFASYAAAWAFCSGRPLPQQASQATQEPQTTDKEALGLCTSFLFGVTLESFSQSAPGVNGSFTGVMAGVYRGYGQPLAAGPYRFTVTNDVSLTSYGTTRNFLAGNPGYPPVVAVGYTNPDRPFINYTASNDPNMANTQIWELGNSLGYITQRQLPRGPSDFSLGPSNNEPGSRLTHCYEGFTYE